MKNHLKIYEKAVDDLRDQMFAKKEQELFALATDLIIETQRASVSFLQRTFHIGYNEAANLMNKLEAEEVVSIAANDGSRVVLMSHDA